jgi:endonuclease/exonuclease/phosphatase family metal-dependent hydrolase
MRFLVLVLIFCLGCSVSSPSVVATAPLSFMTLNVANGYADRAGVAPFRSEASRAAQAAFIQRHGADVVGIQEVDVNVARSGGGNTAEQIFQGMGGTVLYGKAADVDPINGLLAPAPTGSTVGVALWVRSGLAVTESWTVPLDYGDNDWPRSTLFAHVVGEGHDFIVAVTHLSTQSDAIRTLQSRVSVAFEPDVLLGDFNALADSLAPGLAPLQLATASSCIDQIWHRPGLDVQGGLVPTLGVSDHPYAALATWN